MPAASTAGIDRMRVRASETEVREGTHQLPKANAATMPWRCSDDHMSITDADKKDETVRNIPRAAIQSLARRNN
jgi:hypothetical protein